MLLSVTEFIGRFHPLLVHLPIGVLLLALLLQWISTKPAYTISFPVIRLVWWIGMAAAIISCITGYLLSLEGSYEEDLLNIHMWLGISVATLSLFVASKIFKREYNYVYKAGAFLLLLLILLTSHFGGSLTHGSDYLFGGWDETVGENDTGEVRVISNIQEAMVYEDVIQPMLSAKCYSCHGQKKQKGKLRLDGADFILKGGKEGKVVVGGDPEHSELLKRILLPREEDDHMPPKQKPQLKEGQVNLIRWWIEEGCSFNKKVGELLQPDKIKTLLTSLENKKTGDQETIKLIPETPVEAADADAISQLKDKGVIVIPVAAGSNYLSANFVTAEFFSDADMKLIAPISKQLVSLKAGNTKITDVSMKLIGSCRNLIVLQLNNTAVTDNGVPFLAKLQFLQSINLINTRISANGILLLDTLKRLRHIYVYKTAVVPQDYSHLKKVFPTTLIDTGNYSLRFLPSDTQYLTKPKTIAP